MNGLSFLAARQASICDNWMWDLPLRANIEPFAARLRGAAVLDIGCGRGFLSEFLTSQGARVTGIDIVPSARWRATASGWPVYVRGNAERLPFPDDSFDVVVSSSTMQYMDHRSALAELARVTRSEGVLLLHENMPYNPIVLVYRLLRRLRASFSPSLKAYTASIRGYLSPSEALPRTLLLEKHKCYYLSSSLCAQLGQGLCPAWQLGLAQVLFGIDQWSLDHFQWLHRLSWFCSYQIRVLK